MEEQLLKSLVDLEKRCTDVGITPLELYMRQNGLCRLLERDGQVFCTDGVDEALAHELANPTHECSRCFVSFILGLINEKSEPEVKE